MRTYFGSYGHDQIALRSRVDLLHAAESTELTVIETMTRQIICLAPLRVDTLSVTFLRMSSHTISERTATNVRAELGRQRLSQRRLARAIGYSPAKLYRRLSGEVRITLDELQLIADALQVPRKNLEGPDS